MAPVSQILAFHVSPRAKGRFSISVDPVNYNVSFVKDSLSRGISLQPSTFCIAKVAIWKTGADRE